MTTTEEDDGHAPPAPLWRHPLKGRPPRPWQRVAGPAVVAVGVLLAVSMTLDCVTFELGGGAGFLVDLAGGTDSRTYTAPGIAHALAASTPSDGWRPLVRILETIVVLFAVVAPLAHVALLAVLWLAPLAPRRQLALAALADTAYGWASLDVYVVSILATATQTSKLADALAKSQCENVDGWLEAFFDNALDGDTTCFRMAVHVRPGCVVLALACMAQMVGGYLLATVTKTAVHERLAPTPAAGDKLVTRIDTTDDIELVARSSSKGGGDPDVVFDDKGGGGGDDDASPPAADVNHVPLLRSATPDAS